MLKLYNTLSRKVETLKPINSPAVSVYTCGPTVYDFPHIGNWFTFIRYDILIRALKASGYEPKWLMNITDVGHLTSDADEGEDKLEKGAKRDNKNAWQVAEFYSQYFIKGLERLNITIPYELPRATEHINEQIDLIKDLELKGFTYSTSDGVYFDTSKLADYGKLVKLDASKLKEGARVEVNPEKRNPTDFALWKFSPKGHKRDMQWDSPWGKGFPGWHLECSAMSIKYLGKTLDIHAGGIDHIPVHHTNEIAQSEAATGKTFANYWVHMNHIMIKGEKLAKSAGNGITLEDIEKKGFSLEALRLLVLESHYKTQAEFSWEVLKAAQNTLINFRAWADLRFLNLTSSKLSVNYIEVKKEIISTITDNLNTPKALGIINGAINRIEQFGIDSKAIRALAKELDTLLGLELSNSNDVSAEQKNLIKKREHLRKAQDWATADGVRKELLAQGIVLRDTPQGTVWSRSA